MLILYPRRDPSKCINPREQRLTTTSGVGQFRNPGVSTCGETRTHLPRRRRYRSCQHSRLNDERSGHMVEGTSFVRGVCCPMLELSGDIEMRQRLRYIWPGRAQRDGLVVRGTNQRGRGCASRVYGAGEEPTWASDVKRGGRREEEILTTKTLVQGATHNES